MRERHGRVEEHLADAERRTRATKVTRADLPLHCPLPSMYLWNSHPKVYLPIEETGEATVSLLQHRVIAWSTTPRAEARSRR